MKVTYYFKHTLIILKYYVVNYFEKTYNYYDNTERNEKSYKSNICGENS